MILILSFDWIVASHKSQVAINYSAFTFFHTLNYLLKLTNWTLALTITIILNDHLEPFLLPLQLQIVPFYDRPRPHSGQWEAWSKIIREVALDFMITFLILPIHCQLPFIHPIHSFPIKLLSVGSLPVLLKYDRARTMVCCSEEI